MSLCGRAYVGVTAALGEEGRKEGRKGCWPVEIEVGAQVPSDLA